MAYFADSLSWLVRLTIITSLVKSDTDPKIINERINAFKSEYEQSFSNTAEEYIQKVREPIKLFGAKTQGLKNHAEIVKEQATIELENEFDKMVQPILGSSVDDLASSVIDNLTAPKEIVYAIDTDSNEMRIFIGESSSAMV